jgi:hypothetical protein
MSLPSKKTKNAGGYPEEKQASEPTPESKPVNASAGSRPDGPPPSKAAEKANTPTKKK